MAETINKHRLPAPVRALLWLLLVAVLFLLIPTLCVFLLEYFDLLMKWRKL